MRRWRLQGLTIAILINNLLGACLAESMAGTVNMKNEGAKGDGVSDDTAVFKTILEKTKGSGATIEIADGVFVVGTLAFPETTTLQFRNGGKLAVAKGGTVTIDGSVDAGICEIFTGEGAVAGRPKVLHVYPQWFGAKGDEGGDDSAALRNAAGFAQHSSGKTLFIPGGRYRIEGPVEMACNVECRGTIVKRIEIDEAQTKPSFFTFVPTHYPRKNASIVFKPDCPPIPLSQDGFYGIRRGDFKVGQYENIPLAENPGEKINLLEGGTLTFFCSDFFSSRNNQYGDEWYEKNDQCQIVSPRGDVFPEFCFSYGTFPDAPAWNADKVYKKGDYCQDNGKIYKASYQSGPGTVFAHPFKGQIAIGPFSPEKGCKYKFKHQDGSDDSLNIWVALVMTVKYLPPQTPLVVNNLAVEVFLKDTDGKVKRVYNAGSVTIVRSNMTFNNLSISCKNRLASLSALCDVVRSSRITFNNCHFSGATYHGLGYNVCQSNCSNLVFNNCVSVNCRDAIAGRHGKNIIVNGGYFFSIDDHYGMNYTVRDATIQGLSTSIPGYCTPQADAEKWDFVPRAAFVFGGGNIHIENCRVYNVNDILSLRGAEADMENSSITLKDITVTNSKDVMVVGHAINKNFDFAHKILMPRRIVLENIRINEPQRLAFFSEVPEDLSFGDIRIRNCGEWGNFQASAESISFVDCGFTNSEFRVGKNTLCNFSNCVFTGQITGLAEKDLGYCWGNVKRKGTSVPFPLEYKNSAIFD